LGLVAGGVAVQKSVRRPVGTSDRLEQIAEKYLREARKCVKAKAYLAAVIMEVSAFEAMLQSMCCVYPEDVKQTSTYQRKRFRRKRNKALELSLSELINIAREARWFPQRRINWTGKRADLAGFAHEARKVRNFVHPGLWARQRDPLKFTDGIHRVVRDEIIDVAVSWLQHRVERSLLRKMKRECRDTSHATDGAGEPKPQTAAQKRTSGFIALSLPGQW
jgi:hypothetical protein